MSRRLLIIIFMSAMFFARPCVTAVCAMEGAEMSDNVGIAKVSITINESVLRVTGAAGLVMSVYNIVGGVPVMKVRVDGADKRFDLNLPKGIYIVKVGDAVRKIVIK